MSPWPEIMSTGGGFSRPPMRSSASIPSMPGILMSRSTASGRRASIAASPETASGADAVSKPSYSRIIFNASRIEASSSMIRTLGILPSLAHLHDSEEGDGASAVPMDVEAQVIAVLGVSHDLRQRFGGVDGFAVDFGDHVAGGKARIRRGRDLLDPADENAAHV